ncbi:MAG: hypothetical protein AAFV46_12315 [Cyanobacteria bacterium J06635_11]
MQLFKGVLLALRLSSYGSLSSCHSTQLVANAWVVFAKYGLAFEPVSAARDGRDRA